MAVSFDEERIRLAHELADIAGEVIRSYWGKPCGVDHKADDSPVTMADRDAESAMREHIERHFPGDGIVGEEHGNVREDAEVVWVLDPIDGTRSFIVGRPIFGTLIACLRGGHAEIGVIDQPILRDRIVGVDGRPTLRGGAPIRTRSAHEGRLRLSTTGPDYFSPPEQHAFDRCLDLAEFTVYGGDCMQYAWLASGGLDAVIETGLKAHDFAALIPVVRGAGGSISDWQGRELTLASSGQVLAVAHPLLKSRLSQRLSAALDD